MPLEFGLLHCFFYGREWLRTLILLSMVAHLRIVFCNAWCVDMEKSKECEGENDGEWTGINVTDKYCTFFVMAVVWFYLTDVKKGKRDGKVIEGEGK